MRLLATVDDDTGFAVLWRSSLLFLLANQSRGPDFAVDDLSPFGLLALGFDVACGLLVCAVFAIFEIFVQTNAECDEDDGQC